MLLSSPNSVEAMERGRDLLLRLRIDESESAFLDLAAESDGGPAAYHHLATASALKFLLADEDVYYDEFFERSRLLSDELATLPDEPWKAFFIAESYLQEAIVRSKKGRYLRAALAGRKALRQYEQLAEDHPTFYDAYKGLGLLHFTIGSLPSGYRTVLSILGVRGSVDDGLRELELAADSSRYSAVDASILLSLFDILVDTDGEAGGRLAAIHLRYPDSPLFGHLYGFYLYSERQADSALAVLGKAHEHSALPEYFDLDYVEFYIADTLFRLGRFSEAIPYYQRYLDRHRGPALKAMASLRMGMALEMAGQRLAATSFYEDVREARDFDNDRAARRRATRLLESPMSTIDVQLLAGQNAFDSGRYPAAMEVLAGVLEDGDLTPSARSEAEYRLGRCLHVQGDRTAALVRYEASMAADPRGESRWPPWSAYFAGRIVESAGRLEDARAFYDRALSYSGDYDYRHALEKNVKVARERLSRQSTAR